MPAAGSQFHLGAEPLVGVAAEFAELVGAFAREYPQRLARRVARSAQGKPNRDRYRLGG
jgi:hypothetical protein